MHEGRKLGEMIDATRFYKKDFAAACNISKQALNTHLKAERWTDEVWARIKGGMIKLKMDPSEIRVTGDVPTVEYIDLKPLVKGWGRSQLAALRTILEANRDAQRDLMSYINGAMHFSPTERP